MENLPVLSNNNIIPDTHELQVYTVMAKKAADSRMFQQLGGEAGIISIMLYARELGLPPMQAISGGMSIIKGKVELSARTINMMIRKAGHSIKVVEHNDTICRIAGKRSDTGEEYEASFTLDHAKKAGLWSKDNTWDKYTQDLLFARAISRLGRHLFPDVIGNCYVEGEIREAIEADFTPVERPPVPKIERPEKPMPKAKKAEKPVIVVEETIPEDEPKESKIITKWTNFEKYLTQKKVSSEGVQYALERTLKEFDADKIKDIPDTVLQGFHDWLSTELLDELKAESFLPLNGVDK